MSDGNGNDRQRPGEHALTVLVAGATGYLGRHVVADLLAEGHEVRALVRDPDALAQEGTSGAPAIPAGSCEVVVGDVTDPASLRGVADGVDVVVSAIGVTGSTADPWAIDHRGNLALLDETLRAAGPRFAYVNVLDGERIASDVTRAKAAFADVLRRSRAEYLIVNPSGFFSDFSAYFEMARSGLVVLVDGGRARANPIHGADLAAVIRRHLEAGTGGDIDVGGPEVMTHREAAQAAFTALGKRPRIVSMPSVVLRAVRVPMRAASPARAGLMDFMVSALTEDSVAPPAGNRVLSEYYAECARRGR
ncbi:NAD(P)H-binding protein [Mobilicoccus caccae]|uniref:3-beta hydroxysteroid dehydrogenase n=1 Tax=Mobilicoccus caccae TaxID=1859295 RepID=A0ABQ6ITD0_9MICO|nr:NAD(P)H-binding protein [Mobilicoccus caccae]GMA40744.1 3-beta hydroxysteroid dehydrogenase [Mobilicoccus caccae]